MSLVHEGNVLVGYHQENRFLPGPVVHIDEQEINLRIFKSFAIVRLEGAALTIRLAITSYIYFYQQSASVEVPHKPYK